MTWQCLCNFRNSSLQQKMSGIFRLFCSSLKIHQFIQSTPPALQRDPESRSTVWAFRKVPSSWFCCLSWTEWERSYLYQWLETKRCINWIIWPWGEYKDNMTNNQHIKQIVSFWKYLKVHSRQNKWHLFILDFCNIYWEASGNNQFTQYTVYVK